jgi:hypothetical protein
MGEHPFWWLLNMACVVWYGTITVYVAVRGYSEIRKMLARLKEDQPTEDQTLP